MALKHSHPGKELLKMMKDAGLTQRELASKIGVAHSLIHSIIKGSRPMNVNTALALESANIGKAKDWMNLQTQFSLYSAKADEAISRKNELIRGWNQILDEDLVPISFIKKHFPEINSPEDLPKIHNIYGVENQKDLITKIDKFPLRFFRKSSKFQEKRVNVVAWSVVAEYEAFKADVSKFSAATESELLLQLKKVLHKNKNTLNKTKKILADHGIKFLILDRPSKTPVEGKSFMSGNNPAIVMTLKYKRLDNFAFGLFHEICHVYRHLTKDKYRDYNFYSSNLSENKLEKEADSFATNNLIDKDLWLDFLYENETFEDSVIREFADKNKINACIVRGRVCYEFPQYYRKRSELNAENFLG